MNYLFILKKELFLAAISIITIQYMKVFFSHKMAANTANKKVINPVESNYFGTFFAKRNTRFFTTCYKSTN
jgi:hypothetical protein